jgi:hypothetical protein
MSKQMKLEENIKVQISKKKLQEMGEKKLAVLFQRDKPSH